jgi:hypothetical protein
LDAARPSGEYTLLVYARSTIGGFNQVRTVHVTVE